MATTITANGINFPDGSAGSPSIGGTDTNTGLFTGSDIVGFATGGSERLRIDASGNINIANDSGKFQLGTSADLQLFHDGTHSNIVNSTGELKIRGAASQAITFRNSDDSANVAVFNIDDATHLYFDSAHKFSTTSTGIKVVGNCLPNSNDSGQLGTSSVRWQELNITDVIDVSDNGKIRMGDSDDLQLWHNSGTGNSNISGINGNLYLQGNNGSGTAVNQIAIISNGAVELNYQGNKKFETATQGIIVKHSAGGDATKLNIVGPEGNDAILNLIADDGDDDADHWRFVSGTDGNLYMHNYASGSWEKSLKAISNGAVELYHDNSKKLDTTSAGVRVSGVLKAYENESDAHYTADNWHIIQSSNDNNVALVIDHSGNSAPYGMYMRFSDATPDNNTQYFFDCSDSTAIDRFIVWSDGDVDNHDNSYGGTSDVKLKENIVDAKSQWDDIKAVRVRNFNFKSDKPSDKRLGVIAQEIETVCPSLVDEHPDTDENNKDLGTTTKSVKYSILYMKAIKCLQEAMAKIETLEAKVAALEAE